MDLGPHPERIVDSIKLLPTTELRSVVLTAEARIMTGNGTDLDEVVFEVGLAEMRIRSLAEII